MIKTEADARQVRSSKLPVHVLVGKGSDMRFVQLKNQFIMNPACGEAHNVAIVDTEKSKGVIKDFGLTRETWFYRHPVQAFEYTQKHGFRRLDVRTVDEKHRDETDPPQHRPTRAIDID